MTELKITIDQLKNYLGTGLKIMDGWGDVRNFKYTHLDDDGNHGEIFGVKPICYRLSDLDKLIPELGFVPLKRLINDDPKMDESIEIELIQGKIKFLSRFKVFAWIEYEEGDSDRQHVIDFYPFGNQGITPFGFMQKLFQWHFWPFGEEYFEEGLVIDKLKES